MATNPLLNKKADEKTKEARPENDVRPNVDTQDGVALTSLYRFTKNDWRGLAGAVEFSDGGQPLINWDVKAPNWPEGTVYPTEHTVAVIADGNGIEIQGDGCGFTIQDSQNGGPGTAELIRMADDIAQRGADYNQLISDGRWEAHGFPTPPQKAKETPARIPQNASVSPVQVKSSLLKKADNNPRFKAYDAKFQRAIAYSRPTLEEAIEDAKALEEEKGTPGLRRFYVQKSMPGKNQMMFAFFDTNGQEVTEPTVRPIDETWQVEQLADDTEAQVATEYGDGTRFQVGDKVEHNTATGRYRKASKKADFDPNEDLDAAEWFARFGFKSIPAPDGDEESDIYWAKNPKGLFGWYSQDEGSWGVTKSTGDVAPVASGTLFDDSLQKFLAKNFGAAPTPRRQQIRPRGKK